MHPVPKIEPQPDAIAVDPDFRSLNLTRVSHQPKDILDVVKQFTRQINNTRLLYKEVFVVIYKIWTRMEMSDDQGRFDDLTRHLNIAMKTLDGFFFGGLLTGIGPFSDRGGGVTVLKTANNIFAEGQIGHALFLRTGLAAIRGLTAPTLDGKTFIYIDTSRGDIPKSMKDILETLVHEMAHAIYLSFSCRCARCQYDSGRSEVLGQQGHGRLWKEMAEHMRDTIQSWDCHLEDFLDGDKIEWHHINR